MAHDAAHFVDQTDAPESQPLEALDVRQLGPPKPLSNTLERLTEIDETILVQYNDRAPQHLYPKLADRGYQYETIETAEMTVTVIWKV
jgi:hypothetical protein